MWVDGKMGRVFYEYASGDQHHPTAGRAPGTCPLLILEPTREIPVVLKASK